MSEDSDSWGDALAVFFGACLVFGLGFWTGHTVTKRNMQEDAVKHGYAVFRDVTVEHATQFEWNTPEAR